MTVLVKLRHDLIDMGFDLAVKGDTFKMSLYGQPIEVPLANKTTAVFVEALMVASFKAGVTKQKRDSGSE